MIRQNLAADRKYTKYLLYAVGEILLVVIGIVIAVQIGNWNEGIQNEKLERVSLQNLKEDLQIQLEIINEQIATETMALAKSDTAMTLLHGTPAYPEIYRLLRELSSRRTFTANKATFDNLGATGNIVHIQNKELQNAIIRYYQQLDYTTAVITNNNLFLIDSQFGTFVSNNGMGFQMNEDGGLVTNQPMSPTQRFTINNQLIGRSGASASLKNITELLLTSTHELIAQIDKELTE